MLTVIMGNFHKITGIPLLMDELECCDNPTPHIQVIEMPHNSLKFDGYCENCLDRFGGVTEFAGVKITRCH